MIKYVEKIVVGDPWGIVVIITFVFSIWILYRVLKIQNHRLKKKGGRNAKNNPQKGYQNAPN